MRQGSTQTIEIICNTYGIGISEISKICLTISKNNNLPMLTIHDFDRFALEMQEDNRVKATIKLKEDETLNLPIGTLMMQIKFGLLTGDVIVSNILDVEVESGLCKQPMFEVEGA